MKKVLIAFVLLMNMLAGNAQYADKHYIAPSPWQYWSNANEIVVTTRSTTPVSVTLKKSNGTPITTFSVVALNPVSYRFVGNPTTTPRNNPDVVLTDRGLIVEASAPVSVNLRNIASDTPGTSVQNIKGNASLVSFGNEGIGLAFRIGYYRSNYTGISNGAPLYSAMAIEDGTTISLNGSPLGLLNAGESRLFTAAMGTLLSSNKPIVANTGAYGDTPQSCGGSGEDGIVDQIAPINVLGKQYIVVRGNGLPGSSNTDPEQSTIIASEANTTIQVINYNLAGVQFSSTSYTIPAAGGYVSIHHGDGANAYSSTYINASKPVVVYSGTADDCETDISTVLPIGGCSGATDISTRKFINYDGASLSYFGYCILESATDQVFLNGNNLETLTGASRTPMGSSGFYIIRFNNTNIGNPTNINITSVARLTTSIIQQGQGSSMSGFFSAFSDSPQPPALGGSATPCTYTLTTTPGLEPYQWYLENAPIPGATSQDFTATQTGNYTVKGTRVCGPTTLSAPVFITVIPCSNLSVQKQVSSITGNQAVFLITAHNAGPGDEIGVAVLDPLPSGYTFVSATASAGVYDPVSGLWDVNELLNGATETLAVTATINPSGNFTNTAFIIGNNTDLDTSDNTAQAEAKISSLSMTKTAQQPIYYNQGETINYNLLLSNNGQTAITGITVTDINADPGSINPATIAALNPGETVTITAIHTITATDAANGFVLNQASATGQNPSNLSVTTVSDDPSTTAANDATKTIVTVAADLVTVKTNNRTVYLPGTSTVYTITVTNNGPSAAQNVRVNDAMPAGITTMGWTSSLGSSGTGAVNEIIPALPNGGTITYTVTMDIPGLYTGALTNTAVVGSDTPDPDTSCTQCSDTDNPCTPPAYAVADPIKTCDDSVPDGFTEVNLTQFNSTLTQGNTNWQVAFYLSTADVTSGNPIPNPLAFTNTIAYNQTLIVEIISETGCKSYTSMQVTVGQIPTPVLITNEQLCDDGSHLFDLTQYETAILNGQAGATVAGYYNSLSNAETQTNPITDPASHEINSGTASFYLRIENADDCYATSELDLTIFGSPVVSIPAQAAICRDEFGIVIPGLLDTGLSVSDYSFKWYHNSSPLGDTGSSLSVSEEGSYSVEVTSQIGCTGTSATSEVTISNGPDTFNAEVITDYFSDDAIIQATATGIGEFVYWIDYGPEQQSGIFHNVAGGLHDVYVKDVNGCGKILTAKVRVIDYPKFFTPNGDTYNDFWNITGIKDQPLSMIYIFDRYGKLLKQLRPFGPGWDGTFNGYPLPSTDYWFKVLYTESGVSQEFRSHFSLKR